MSTQTDEISTKVTSGTWERVDGKIQFVENTYEVPNDEREILINKDSEVCNQAFQLVTSQYTSNFNMDCYTQDRNSGLNNVMEKMNQLENQFIRLQEENMNLKSKIRSNKIFLEEQLEYIYSLEEDLNRLNQYGRRENVEIQGIPAYVSDSMLEHEVLKILHSIGLTRIDHFGIVACHRIGRKDVNGNRNTLIRFLNRKDAIATLMNKKKVYLCKELGYSNLNFIENLCPAYRSIFDELVELKKEGCIQKVWTYNGQIKYLETVDEQEKT